MSQAKAINQGNKFADNVFGFADADFEMDLDVNFHEAEATFFEKLGFSKKPEVDEDGSDEEVADKKPK